MSEGIELAKAYLTVVPTMRGMAGALKGCTRCFINAPIAAASTG